MDFEFVSKNDIYHKQAMMQRVSLNAHTSYVQTYNTDLERRAYLFILRIGLSRIGIRSFWWAIKGYYYPILYIVYISFTKQKV